MNKTSDAFAFYSTSDFQSLTKTCEKNRGGSSLFTLVLMGCSLFNIKNPISRYFLIFGLTGNANKAVFSPAARIAWRINVFPTLFSFESHFIYPGETIQVPDSSPSFAP